MLFLTVKCKHCKSAGYFLFGSHSLLFRWCPGSRGGKMGERPEHEPQCVATDGPSIGEHGRSLAIHHKTLRNGWQKAVAEIKCLRDGGS
eukprot:m.83578 g.83578  ORF g.83578 m.83578 type:complete len:89 (-) comp21130_c0_seq3:209-475(-)